MSRTHHTAVTPSELIRILKAHRRLWIIPTVAIGFLSLVYAVIRPATWDASQALMVRDEAMGTAARPGKFSQPEDMKTTQETILELARSRVVLEAALKEVGPATELSADSKWPTEAAIRGLQSTVKLVPPKGAEFGKTEVFYLNVEAENRSRAVALTSAICRELQLRSQELRDQKAQSLIAELSRTAELAKADLETNTVQLTKIESSVGADLGELRILTEVGGGDSPLRRSLNEMDQEFRQAQQAIDANQELLSLLQASKTDARSLSAAPNRLLEAQPVLRRLKDGLVDAQLRTAQLSGNLTDNHPSVIAAKVAEHEIGDSVRDEIDSAIVGVQAELRLSQNRASILQSQLNDARVRLGKLADMRAEYANVVAERNQRADILKGAEQQLAEARASQAAARTASVITAIDAPVPSNGPIGPGKASIVLGGLLGGLFMGFGIVFLTVHPSQSDFALIPSETASKKQFSNVNSDLNPEKIGVESMLANGGSVNGPSTSKQGVNDYAANGYAFGNNGLSLKQALRKLVVAQ